MSAYQFHAERLTTAITSAMTTVDEGIVDDLWEELIDDESEFALLITEVQLPDLVVAILENLTPQDPSHGDWHWLASAQLAGHRECEQVIDTLIAQRNDVIASILDARSHLRTETHESEFGTEYVTIEGLLDALRPTVKGSDVRWNVLQDPDVCPDCSALVPHWNYLAEHHEGCALEEQKDQLQHKRNHLIAAHIFCSMMGAELMHHTRLCLERVEQIAASIGRETQTFDDWPAVQPRDVIDEFDITDLNVAPDDAQPATFASAVFPAISV